jgi:hypothetical protein
MFILNRPTPSVGQFVRIGGGPAGLGNWPNLPEFPLPGVLITPTPIAIVSNSNNNNNRR